MAKPSNYSFLVAVTKQLRTATAEGLEVAYDFAEAVDDALQLITPDDDADMSSGVDSDGPEPRGSGGSGAGGPASRSEADNAAAPRLGRPVDDLAQPQSVRGGPVGRAGARLIPDELVGPKGARRG